MTTCACGPRKSSEKICTTKDVNFNNASTLSRNGNDDSENPRPFPSFPRVFPSALLARIPIARYTGCSSGIMRPEEFSQAWAGWGTDGVRLIELVVRDFPASGGNATARWWLRRRIIRYNPTARWVNGVKRGKKREAMSIDVMKPVLRKAPYREWHGTNLFTPRRLWNCNPQAARPSSSRRSPWKCFQMLAVRRRREKRETSSVKSFVFTSPSFYILFLLFNRMQFLITPEWFTPCFAISCELSQRSAEVL